MKCNIIDRSGRLLSPKLWFDRVINIGNEIYLFKDDETYLLDKNCRIHHFLLS